MAHSATAFPLSGVIGILDAGKHQLELARQLALSSVEIRADLLRSAGLSDDELMALVAQTKAAGLSCLFTLRHADQGGTFAASENERVGLCKQAIVAGADIIDLEHGTDAAAAMLEQSAPMILSYHNFNRMLQPTELADLTLAMEQQNPAAVKIIPTGSSLVDAATMLGWVSAAGDSIRRIGFSMGADGAVSRILTLASGAPVTYASFGEPVAPGQIDIQLLLNQYGCMSMSPSTKVTALIGDQAAADRYLLNQAATGDDHVTIVIAKCDAQALVQYQTSLNITDIVQLAA